MSVNSDPESSVQARKRARGRHTRSTTGCLTCREHKKKCDEQKPVCKRCRTNDRQCHWQASESSDSPRREGSGSRAPEDSGRQRDFAASVDLDTSCSRRPATLDVSLGQANDTTDLTSFELGPRPPDSTSITRLVAASSSSLTSSTSTTTGVPVGQYDAYVEPNLSAEPPVDKSMSNGNPTLCIDNSQLGGLTWADLENQFDSTSFESLLSTAFSGSLWTPNTTAFAFEQGDSVDLLNQHGANALGSASAVNPTHPSTQAHGHGQDQGVFPGYTGVPADHNTGNHGQIQPLFTPVQVFLPPMYAAPLGPVNLPDTTDEGLLHYFMTVASKTWSALDSFGSPSSVMLLPAPVDTSSSACARSLHGALLHAMLCASATHSHNLSSSVAPGSQHYGQQAKKHRVESFRLLHASVSSGTEPQDTSGLTLRNRAESRVATVMLLILSSVFDGDAKTVPTLLRNAQLEFPSCGKSNNVTCYMALHSIYCILNGLSRQTKIEIDKLVWTLSDNDTEWLGRTKRLVMMITGATHESLLDLARVHNLIMEHRQLTESASRLDNTSTNTNDAHTNAHMSSWRIAEIEGQLDFLDGELQNDVPHTLQVGNAETSHLTRVQIGSRLFRTATRVYALRAVFGAAKDDARVEDAVSSVIRDAGSVVHGTEVGLSWPLILVGCEIGQEHQAGLLAIVKRCQWKNSVSTRFLEEIITSAWKDGKPWHTSTRRLGYPLIL